MAREQMENQRPALVVDTLTLMEGQFPYIAGVEDLADRAGVDKCHLIREFTRVMGVSPGQYLTRVRIQKAQDYLRERDYPVEVVAGLVGYANSNYFCKAFRKSTGMTPGEYRRSQAGQAAPQKSSPTEDYYYV